MTAGAALRFERPSGLDATRPPEQRGTRRDGVRLLLSTPRGHRHHTFRELPSLLEPGDLLVVNDSATLAASLPARRAEAPAGSGSDLGGERFRLNLSTRYGERLWLAEPRPSATQPGPLPGPRPLPAGERARVGRLGQLGVTFVAPYPGLPRLWFVMPDAPLEPVMALDGEPIRYAYLAEPQPLDAYQTVFARVAGSAEMPSAARPFTPELLAALRRRGVRVATLTLHAGVSSLELPGGADADEKVLYPEPFAVPAATAAAVRSARRRGSRVVAVGTTVVRALETAAENGEVEAMRGFSRRFVRAGDVRGTVDGLITGLHEPASSHLALLLGLAGQEMVREAYAAAVAGGYLWHEFGDSHLLLWEPQATAAPRVRHDGGQEVAMPHSGRLP